MFWNALVRKRKAEHVDEDDMPVVVKIHNEMNERTWKMLLGWEAAHAACVSRARARASMPRYA
jgi:cytochrome c heme-lyase